MANGTTASRYRAMDKFPVKFFDFVGVTVIAGVSRIESARLTHLIGLLVMAGRAVFGFKTGM